MITVIPTDLHNGGTTTGFNDKQYLSQLIQDFQEVDLYRTPSAKPLPKELFSTVDGEVPTASIRGNFLVQIVSMEPSNPLNETLRLTITDGFGTINAHADGSISHLNANGQPGSKLLLTETIPIQDGSLQLNGDNTQFHFGSSTYPRPRSAHRGRTSGASRQGYEGRRNLRYENEDGETNFLKRPPPKTTLIDFMPQWKNSGTDAEQEKGKERNGKRRPTADASQPTLKNNHSNHVASAAPFNAQPASTILSKDQTVVEQDGIDESGENDDDPAHGLYRERRNPLPPRLQRAQEERSRRNPGRYPDDMAMFAPTDFTSLYHPDVHLRRATPDGMTYLPNNSSAHTPFMSHANLIGTINGSAGTHLAYYPTNAPNPLTYGLTTYGTQQLSLASAYPNDRGNFCYGTTAYPVPNYAVPSVLPSDSISQAKLSNGNGCSTDERDKKIFVEQSDENRSNSSSNETQINSTSSSTATLNDPPVNQPSEEKRREVPNPRPRWKVGDVCLARWSEDGEFYFATVLQIQVPFCHILFTEYNTYDKVHFNQMKPAPRDQHYYHYYPSSIVPSTEYNPYAGNAFYSAGVEGCLFMPEAPPFPFNADGTLYMCPAPLTSFGRPPTRRAEQVPFTTQSSSSGPSKDDEGEDEADLSASLAKLKPCSIADSPLTLVTADDLLPKQEQIQGERD